MAQSSVRIISAPDTLRRFVSEVPASAFRGPRRSLLLTILDDVICYQLAFLDFGPEWIFEDSLNGLAERIGSTESQVSRAVKGVMVRTEHGDTALRDLFRPGIRLMHGVRRVSNYSVAMRIERLVEQEDPRRPYTDAELSGELVKEGISVSRRTVAKYRLSRGVPESRRRRGGEWVRQVPKKTSRRAPSPPATPVQVKLSPRPSSMSL